MRRLIDRAREDEGLTIIEVVVAFVVFLIITTSAMKVTTFLIRGNMTASLEDVSTQKAFSLIEKAQSVRWDSLGLTDIDNASRNAECAQFADLVTSGEDVVLASDGLKNSNVGSGVGLLDDEVTANRDMRYCVWVRWMNGASGTSELGGQKKITSVVYWDGFNGSREHVSLSGVRTSRPTEALDEAR